MRSGSYGEKMRVRAEEAAFGLGHPSRKHGTFEQFVRVASSVSRCPQRSLDADNLHGLHARRFYLFTQLVWEMEVHERMPADDEQKTDRERHRRVRPRGTCAQCRMTSMIGRLRTVVLDAAGMDAEAQFWSAMLGIPIVHRSEGWTTIQGRDVRLAVQLAPDHVPLYWPDPSHPQQLHLDIEVDDVDEAERQVLALGARRLAGREDFRVYSDPAGHPFCLVFNT